MKNGTTPFDLAQARRVLAGTSGKRFWSSLEEIVDQDGFRQWLEAEFPSAAAVLTQPARREMLKLMAARLGAQWHWQLAGAAARPLRRFSPGIDALEDRWMPSTLEILSPAAGGYVDRYATLTGHVDATQVGAPLVLIQPVIDGEPWYVRPQVLDVDADGNFSTPVSFGNGSTPDGTQFRVGHGHPGGQVKSRPPSRCMCRCGTVCPACSLQLMTSR